MKPDFSTISKYSAWVRWGAVVLPLALVYGAASLAAQPGSSPWLRVLFGLVGLILSGASYWLADRWLENAAAQRRLALETQTLKQQVSQLQERIALIRRINTLLVEAPDERSLMEALLGQIGRLVGATGLSYIPLDEWGQPLASVLHGEVPPQLLEQWLAHLNDSHVKGTCKDCQALHVRTGEPCPLAAHPFQKTEEIDCLHVRRGDRLLGMVNLYLPDPARMDADTRQFLDGLLAEVAMAVETLRLRNQEISTLRQIQMLRTPDHDLVNQLSSLLVSTQQALEVDYALLSVRGTDKIPAVFLVGKGLSTRLDAETFHQLFDQVYSANHLITQVAGAGSLLPGNVGALLAAPISLEGGPTLGVIMVANAARQAFYPRQLRVLETVTAQAAVLVDHEYQLLDLEYRAIIEERTRLAREIHDGLAQTLAFLKMQVSQMQSYLAREDTSRVKDILRTTHRTLSDAYQDARQAIDHLRVAPNDGVAAWLEQAVLDFQNATDITSTLTIQPGLTELPQEAQAQLLRVVQEALSNIRKHAHASQVHISMRRWEGETILEIKDNGDGFSPDDVPSVSQYGLRGMRERAEMLGADFQIISQPNAGTTVRLRLPDPLEEAPV